MTDNLNKANTSEEQTPDFNFQKTTETDVPVKLSDFTQNKVHSYVKLSDKYNDITSSAFTMLFVGIAGILFMALVLLEIIPLPLNPETSWLFYSVMGGIFIIFIVSGVISFMHAKQVKIDADVEDNLIEEILSWADKNLSQPILDKGLDTSQPNELLFFSRADKIQDALMHRFENTDEALIYELTEQIYQRLYEK